MNARANSSADSGSRPPPIYGLVLAGGASRRMQADKARLDYHGKSQTEWTLDLLRPFCRRLFVSLRAKPIEKLPAGVDAIVDGGDFVGPAAGILSAMRAHPQVAWLVVACDLPFLDAQTLARLLAERDPESPATAFSSVSDALPEPLCALWEPASRESLEKFLREGRNCPRKFLINAPAKLIDQPHPGALDNINTPTERAAACERLQGRQ